jgi:excisionase family DNA binding protein
MTLEQAAIALSVSQSTVRRLITQGSLLAQQHCKGAPWIIRRADLERDEIRRLADLRRSRRPPPDERQQYLLDLSTT